jgi:HTH-type transcriptional regulator/antitoxin HigA
MRHGIRVIKGRDDYDLALQHLAALIDQQFAAGSSEEADLELVALVIDAYDQRMSAPVAPDPIEAVLFRMDQQNLDLKALVPLLGPITLVSEVLARKRPLSLEMIAALHKELGIPASVLSAAL